MSGFATTRRSVVLAAGGAPTRESRAALETLCKTYWFPLYGLARRRGLAPGAAEDAVQGFIATLLERRAIAAADPARGRFRASLATASATRSRTRTRRA